MEIAAQAVTHRVSRLRAPPGGDKTAALFEEGIFLADPHYS